MGGLYVAAIQLSIGLAAAIGGNLYNYFGIGGLFITSACVMSLAIYIYISYFFSLFKHYEEIGITKILKSTLTNKKEVDFIKTIHNGNYHNHFRNYFIF